MNLIFIVNMDIQVLYFIKKNKMLLLLFFVLSSLAQVMTDYSDDDDRIEKRKTINYIHQHHEMLTNHRKFTESQSIIIIEINNCFPKNIQYIINNMTLFYKSIDYNHVTESLFFTKLSKDLQNHKSFCNAINDASIVYIKRMSYLINMKYYKPNIAKEIKKRVNDYNIHKRCLDEKMEYDNFELFKCIKDTERRALFNALRQ